MRRTLLLVAVVALCAGCRDDAVQLGFRPAQGATYAYATTVDSSTHTTVSGVDVPDEHDHVELSSDARVLATDGRSAQLQVVLNRPGSGSRTYVMRFDRAAQLTKVESVEGIPAASLGDLGLTEIFPAAAGAPPDEALHAGDRWTIDDAVQLEGATAPVQLEGTGQLVELGVIDGRRTATVRSTTVLPVRTISASQTLDGTQTTVLSVTYDLADGSVTAVHATTTAKYALTIAPPAGALGGPVTGTLSVVVRSTTARR